VEVKDIYDEVSFGEKDPAARRSATNSDVVQTSELLGDRTMPLR
jgi:hypothetical protein